LVDPLLEYRGRDVVVLGLPRGGVPVAHEVAHALNAPLDVILVRKLGVPGQPELAMGAVGEGGVLVRNDDVVRVAGVTSADFAEAVERERAEVDARAARLRSKGPVPLSGRIAIIVDDGIATGATARAACDVARAHGADQVVLAVPVGAPDTIAGLAQVADEVVCLSVPRQFRAVGQAYDDFDQVGDAHVVQLLAGTRSG
jgi:putative phosphoribosyl transferase